MPSEAHENLCMKGVAWLKRNGFGVAAANVWAFGSRERVDCIGFRHNCSVLLEAKVSRSDFKADIKKPERQCGGAGTYRAYISPAGLISVSELPERWGLLELVGRSLTMRHGPTGNLWPGFNEAANTPWMTFAHDIDMKAERGLLFSLARRGCGK